MMQKKEAGQFSRRGVCTPVFGKGGAEAKRQKMLLRLEAWRKPRNGSAV